MTLRFEAPALQKSRRASPPRVVIGLDGSIPSRLRIASIELSGASATLPSARRSVR